MKKPTHAGTAEPAELAIAALALVREQAPETRLLPIAARPVAEHPEYQQVNRIGRDGAALKRGWTADGRFWSTPPPALSYAPSAIRTTSISRPRCSAPCRPSAAATHLT